MIGKTILHYKILEMLGEGGMGVVYLAEDSKLERKVAIKFLPHYISINSEERERFKIEAKAAASLNHPNIATIYAIEETEDQIFIVMEYIEGVELKDKIKSGSIPTNEAINIAIQIAEGLEAAHKNGIVHRDIKSQNIMITNDGKVKIMDFGLAKVKGGTQLTKIGSTVGTAAYMSPEQAKGQEVDFRTDIWSFGVVLYEVLFGQLPFNGDYEAAVLYEIVNVQLRPADNFRSDIPTELMQIIHKSLEKNPDQRFHSISVLLNDLSRLISNSSKIIQQFEKVSQLKTGSSGKQKKKLFSLTAVIISLILISFIVKIFFLPDGKSTDEKRFPIAVVDFINQTNEPELDGLSGMLITSLEQSRKLAVVTRSRMFDILNQMEIKDVIKIDESLGLQLCQQANIDAMVIASIRKFGKLYTIDLKVVDPNKNEYLFTANEVGEGQENIPSMLDKLSEKTRIGLKERVTQVNETNLNVASVTTTNFEAYQHFFQGEQLINQLKIIDAIEEFKKAVALDSTFAQAYYRLVYAESWQNESEVIQKNHLEHALMYINRMPEKEQYLVRATKAIIDNDYRAGLAILKKMEQIYPDNKEMIYNIGDWSYHVSDYSNAIKYLEKTLQIDPNHQRALQHLTWTYRDIENFDKMVETAKKYVAVSGSGEAYQILGEAHSQLGQFDQGIKFLVQARDLFPDNYRITGSIANLYIYQNDYANAELELKKLVEKNLVSEIKSYGYHRLSNFYPYAGKYRKAIKMSDRRIELLENENDTVLIATEQIFKGFKFTHGWSDSERAWEEVVRTVPVQDNISNNYFWGSVNLAQVYHKDYRAAEILSKTLSPEWWALIIQSTVFSLKQDLKNAEIFADSVIQTGNEFAMMFVLYPLAECQYEHGDFNKALESLNKMQTIYDPVWIRGIYYPKSFYLLGKIYERKGNSDLAIKNYERFLDLWKNADNDLPDLLDAKSRYAKIKELAFE